MALAVVAITAAGGFVAYMAWSGGQLQRDGRAGLTAMYKGDDSTAQRYFTQAMNEARSPQDRATYEIFLAGSLEASAPAAAADHYLHVITDAALPAATRGSAGVYLLMLLNVRHGAAFTKGVF